jgi:hypothetical protein
MSESVTNGYKRLFEVRMLHHYWLDEGATAFDQIGNQATRDSRLLNYDKRSFLAVRPSLSTAKMLAGYHCIFRETPLGFVIAAPANLKMPDDTVLEFVVTVQDSRLFEYTALTLQAQTIYEIYADFGKTIYRYKENVPVLSNVTGAKRGAGANEALFLSQELPSPTGNDQVESLVLSGNSLAQLTSDDPGATTQQLAANATDLPVYLHQGDVPAITPPAGLAGAPAKGVRLSEDVADDVFAYLSLRAVRANDAAFSFIDGAGGAKAVPPVYQIRFKNRSTYWRYLDKRTSAVNSTEANPLPLTYFGNAGAKQKPSGSQVKAEKSGQRITRLVSEIYV